MTLGDGLHPDASVRSAGQARRGRHRAARHGAACPPCRTCRCSAKGGRSTVAEFTDWTTDLTLDRAWLLDPCRPTGYPTDR
jgi:hypothetical protein